MEFMWMLWIFFSLVLVIIVFFFLEVVVLNLKEYFIDGICFEIGFEY